MKRAVGQVLAGSIVLSLLGGVAWAFIAKPTRFVVVSDGMGQAVNGDNVNEFGAIGWFALISVLAGLALSSAAWMRLRVRRGIGLLVAIVVAAFLGSLTTAALGELIVRLRYPLADNPPIDSVVSFAPQILYVSADYLPVVLILEPLGAAVTILVMAALSPFDDLGTGRSAITKPMEPAGVEYQR